jgi:hypothetical protein
MNSTVGPNTSIAVYGVPSAMLWSKVLPNWPDFFVLAHAA